MSLEHAFRRLAVRPSPPRPPCAHRHRTLATWPPRQQQQSATASFADMLTSSRAESHEGLSVPYNPMARRTAPTQTAVRPPSELPQAGDIYTLARQAVHESNARPTQQQNRKLARDAERGWSRKDLEQQAIRKWAVGDVYAPHDLSGVEMSKWKKIRAKPRLRFDVIDQLGLDPLKLYRNFSIMSEYISEMGRIKHSNETGLRPVNQRKMAKAIRRAMGMGLMPGVHRHPEILKKDMENTRPSY